MALTVAISVRRLPTIPVSAPTSISDNLVLIVTDNKFVRHWGVATIPVEVAPDGTFSAGVVVSTKPHLRQAQIKGKISGGNLEADIGTDLCAGHMSLKK